MANDTLTYELVNGFSDYRKYKGLKADLGNLPTNLRTGSTFYAVDAHELYMFEATTATWYKQ